MIVIKGDMPKNCDECDIQLSCPIHFEARKDKTSRHSSCPIIGEIPDKHGNLKDADFIISCLEEIKDEYPKTYEVIKGILDRTPTVLEATE